MAATVKRGKRANGEGSIRQRPDGCWEARFSYEDRDSRTRRDSAYGKTQREALEGRKARLQEIARHGAPITERQTVAQFLARWLDDVVKPNRAYKTYVSYELTVRLHLAPKLGHLQLTRLTAQHVQALIREKGESGLSPRSVQYIAAVLRIALNKAVRWELVARNVAAAIDVPRAPRAEVRPLSDAEARRFLEVVRGDRLEALFVTAMTSGLRQGELLGLAWEDIDLDGGIIRVRRQLQRVEGKQTLRDLKTPKSRRTVEIPPLTVAALRAHRRRQLGERLAAGDRWQDWGLVFMTPLGTPLEPSGVLKRFKRQLAEAGLPRQRFHDLRHLFACLLLLRNTHPKVVQDLLGHTQISTTMDTYSHVMPTMRRAAADSVEAIFAAVQ
jgi:integrase